jgi:hypothetical protein
MGPLLSPAHYNPDTYLNYLPSQEARQYEITRNVLLVLLGVSSSSIIMFSLAHRLNRLQFGISLLLSLMI